MAVVVSEHFCGMRDSGVRGTLLGAYRKRGNMTVQCKEEISSVHVHMYIHTGVHECQRHN